MPRVRFTAEVVRRRQILCLDLPADVTKKLGHTGRVPVKGTLNSYPLTTSVFPTDDGGHFMMINPEMSKMAGVSVGSKVKVVLDVDARSQGVDVPADLQKVLDDADRATKAWNRLSYSHQQEYVDWIEEAKRPETRARRIEKTVERLNESPLPGED